jgi:hypothetical protein
MAHPLRAIGALGHGRRPSPVRRPLALGPLPTTLLETLIIVTVAFYAIAVA